MTSWEAVKIIQSRDDGGLARVVAMEIMEVVRFWICIEIRTAGVAYVCCCEGERIHA